MDIKKINLRKISENRGKIIAGALKFRRLLILIVLGCATVYSFNLLYRKAYIEPNFIQYSPNANFVSVNRENTTLEKIMNKIDQREKNTKDAAQKQYKDPFSFSVPKTSDNVANSQDKITDAVGFEDSSDSLEADRQSSAVQN